MWGSNPLPERERKRERERERKVCFCILKPDGTSTCQRTLQEGLAQRVVGVKGEEDVRVSQRGKGWEPFYRERGVNIPSPPHE